MKSPSSKRPVRKQILLYPSTWEIIRQYKAHSSRALNITMPMILDFLVRKAVFDEEHDPFYPDGVPENIQHDILASLEQVQQEKQQHD